MVVVGGCVFCRAAPSAQSPRLHRACVRSATSGYAISALTCTSIRDPPSTQTCTHSRGPVPSSVLTCTRKAPVLFLQMDKAWNLHDSKLCRLVFRPVLHIIHFSVTSDSLFVCWKSAFFLIYFPAVLHLFVSHISVCAIAMNNACNWRWLITVPGYPCVLLHLSLTHGPDSKVLKWFHFG